jgi:uncharacterized membrane protein YhdT
MYGFKSLADNGFQVPVLAVMIVYISMWCVCAAVEWGAKWRMTTFPASYESLAPFWRPALFVCRAKEQKHWLAIQSLRSCLEDSCPGVDSDLLASRYRSLNPRIVSSLTCSKESYPPF